MNQKESGQTIINNILENNNFSHALDTMLN